MTLIIMIIEHIWGLQQTLLLGYATKRRWSGKCYFLVLMVWLEYFRYEPLDIVDTYRHFTRTSQIPSLLYECNTFLAEYLFQQVFALFGFALFFLVCLFRKNDNRLWPCPYLSNRPIWKRNDILNGRVHTILYR